MALHNDTGKKGEALAADWLLKKGFVIHHSNWRHSHYEIDVVASRTQVLHFIEVKTRTGRRFGLPEESVNDKKLESLMRASSAYLAKYRGFKRVQYDILSIILRPPNDPEFYLVEDVYCRF